MKRGLLKNRTLKLSVLLSVLALCSSSICMAENILENKNNGAEVMPTPGTYDSVNVIVDKKGESVSGLRFGFTENNTGNFVITNGGKIDVKGYSTTAYGIWAPNWGEKVTNLKIGGDLEVNLDNTNSTYKDKVVGIWKYGGYNPIPGGDSSMSGDGSITLNDTTLTVKGNTNAYGILAGSDFGNNSELGGNIISNGNLKIDVSTKTQIKDSVSPTHPENVNRTFGVFACDGGNVSLNGKENIIKVTGIGSGYNYKETSGLYNSFGGNIMSSKDSLLNIDVTGKKIYGISAGYYDIIDKNSQGKSKVNLQGKTTLNLHGNDSVGVAAYEKAQVNIKDLTINFDENSRNNKGILAADGSDISIGSLYVGTKKEGFLSNPNKITAISTEKEWGNYWAGNIKVNEDTTNTVQVVGKIQANWRGNVNLTLSNKDSYFYGNASLKDYSSKDGKINLTITNGANWTNVQNTWDGASEVTSLALSNGGIVNLTDTEYTDVEKHKFQNMFINEKFKGNGGILQMDIDAATNKDNSDRVFVKGTHEGTHYITLNNVGKDIDGAEGTILVSVKDEQGEFKANDSEGKLYWNRYTLDKKIEDVTEDYTVDWVLKEVEQIEEIDKPTTSVETILGANALNYHTWRAETDKLMKRLGDLRHNNGIDDEGIWVRVRGSKIGRDDKAVFENQYKTYEIGYDYLDKETEKYKRYCGASLSYIDGSSSYNNGNGENDGKALSFYRTTMGNKGHYLDFVFKIMAMKNEFNVVDSNATNIKGESHNEGISLNLEYGRKKMLGDDWYIEPQSQLTLGYLGGDRYITSNGIKVDQGGTSSLVGRLGFNIGRDVDENTNLYLKANVLHEFLGKNTINMQDVASKEKLTKEISFKDTWFEVGVGAAIKTGKNSHIYCDVEKSFGGDFKKDWAWNAGMRFEF